MYQSIPFFGHIFLYFSLDFFYLSTQYICLLNLQCQRFQIFVFYTFLHALGAGYRRKAKALGKHCLYKYHKYRITLSLDICEFKNINLLKHDIWDYFKSHTPTTTPTRRKGVKRQAMAKIFVLHANTKIERQL